MALPPLLDSEVHAVVLSDHSQNLRLRSKISRARWLPGWSSKVRHPFVLENARHHLFSPRCHRQASGLLTRQDAQARAFQSIRACATTNATSFKDSHA